MKKMAKKILASLLAIMMALSVFSCVVMADETKPVNWLVNSADSMNNISAFHATAAIDMAEKTEGLGSLKLTESDGMIQLHVRDNFLTLRNVDVSQATYVSFDLYTEDINMFAQGDKAIEFFDTSNRCSGRMGTSEALTALTLVNGWNHIKLQLGAFDTSSGFDATKFQHINFFATSVSTTATYRFDNFRIGNEAGYEMIDVLAAKGFSALNDGYSCFGAQEIDTTDSTEGDSCLKVATFDGYNNMQVILNQPGDITGATYLVFDVYTDDVNLFKGADDTAGSFFNNDAFTGRAVIHNYLREVTLQAGWNHVVVPIAYTELNGSFDAATLSKFELYIFRINGYPEGTVVKFDNMRFCNYEGLQAQAAAEKAEQLIDAIGEVTLTSGEAIQTAEQAYNALPASVLSLVDNYDVLVAAKQAYEVLENQKIDFTVDIQDATASVGRELTVPVYVTVEEGQNVAALQLAIGYDKEKLEFVNATTTIESVPFDFNAQAAGYDSKVLLAFAKEGGITESGVWFNLTFKALAEGEAAFTVETYDKEPCDAENNVLTVALTGGKATVTKQLGDVNFDGTVDSKDALEALKVAVKKTTFTDEQMALGDLDGDGIMSAIDALYMLRYAVGKITQFPIEK